MTSASHFVCDFQKNQDESNLKGLGHILVCSGVCFSVPEMFTIGKVAFPYDRTLS